MRLNTKKIIPIIVVFIIIYSVFIFSIDIFIDNYDDIIIASTFFFALFTGFFITRQNGRYSSVANLISETDGLFSFLYRISGFIPRVQKELREIIRAHYQKILKSGDWAYHVHNPSDTITKVTNCISSIKKEEMRGPVAKGYFWHTSRIISKLQINRKQMVGILGEKLTPLHWGIVSILSIIVMVSFGFMPTSSIVVQILKILFGTAVLMSVLLLIQLDQLTIFSENAAESTARDIFHIIDEKDEKLLGKGE